MSFGEESFEPLEDHVDFCIDNIRQPNCTLEEAGRFYEEAAEALRAHGILRLLIDADGDGFSNDLVMSGHARRAWLRRCARKQYADYFLALSRTGSFFDAVAGDDLDLAAEIFRLSPAEWRKGDEYEDDFCYQRSLGLHLTGAPAAEIASLMARLEKASEGGGARLAICRVLHEKGAGAFEGSFQDLLRQREEEIAEDKDLAEEELTVAIGAKVFVEGIAVLKLARRAGLPVALEYPMCPALALLPRQPARPPDEFSPP